MHGWVSYLPCGEWDPFFLTFIYYVGWVGGYTFSCLLLSFHLLSMRYVRYSTAISWVVLTFI